MSSSNNIIFLHGFVGKDAEVKSTPGGQQFARFPFATTETWTNPQGEKQQKTEWHQIIAWAAVADRVGKYIKKGTELNIVGKVEYQERKNEAGEVVYPPFVNIKLRDFTFCGKKGTGSSNDRPDPEPSGRDAYPDQHEDNGNTTSAQNGGYDEDIPF